MSEPVWIVSAEGNEKNNLTLENGKKIEINTSNNNLAIKLFGGRIYFGFRSATHHHPKPPIWAPQYLGVSQPTTRLFVLSAEWKPGKGSFEETVKALRWRVEMEMNETLNGRALHPHARQLVLGTDQESQSARKWFVDLLGEIEARPLIERADKLRVKNRSLASLDKKEKLLTGFLEDYRTFLVEYDLREPFFLVLNDRLHFYCQFIEGRSMKFNSLRTWNMSRGANDAWTEPVPVLGVKEHFWDIQTRKEGGKNVAYLTSYSGGHYLVDDETVLNSVHFKRSENGLDWTPAGGKEFVYRGGASEAAFVFLPGAETFLTVLRLDDGDDRGWGSLFGSGDMKKPGDWDIAKRADPRRFDSPRLFLQGGQVYLFARQNICETKDGKPDETRNCPYDRLFVGDNEKEAETHRETLFEKIKLKLMSRKDTKRGKGFGISLQYEYTYYFHLAKRTALYWYDAEKKDWVHNLTLPSTGDTAFPSAEPLGNGEYLLANYSSSLANPNWSWRDGQQNRSGIYFMKLTFPK